MWLWMWSAWLQKQCESTHVVTPTEHAGVKQWSNASLLFSLLILKYKICECVHIQYDWAHIHLQGPQASTVKWELRNAQRGHTWPTWRHVFICVSAPTEWFQFAVTWSELCCMCSSPFSQDFYSTVRLIERDHVCHCSVVYSVFGLSDSE